MARRHYGNGFYVGLGAGAGIPTQAIRNAYDAGVTVAVPIGWDAPLGPLGFRVDLGYTRLNSRSTFRNTGSTAGTTYGTSGTPTLATADAQVWSALANAKLRLPILGGFFGGPTSGLYAVGGGGVNYFRNYNTTFGLTNPEFTTTNDAGTTSLARFALDAGGGISWGIGASEVFLESRYVTAFTENRRASYVPIILGVTFR
jgi:hypothetical protein